MYAGGGRVPSVFYGGGGKSIGRGGWRGTDCPKVKVGGVLFCRD